MLHLRKKPLMYVKDALDYQCNCSNALHLIELWTSKLRYSNYFTSMYMVGFLKFSHNFLMKFVTSTIICLLATCTYVSRHCRY